MAPRARNHGMSWRGMPASVAMDSDTPGTIGMPWPGASPSFLKAATRFCAGRDQDGRCDGRPGAGRDGPWTFHRFFSRGDWRSAHGARIWTLRPRSAQGKRERHSASRVDMWSWASPGGRLRCMRNYLSNRWTRIGLGLIIFGWGPLVLIVLLAAAGLWPDPNPNPIGPGIRSSSRPGPPSSASSLAISAPGGRAGPDRARGASGPIPRAMPASPSSTPVPPTCRHCPARHRGGASACR